MCHHVVVKRYNCEHAVCEGDVVQRGQLYLRRCAAAQDGSICRNPPTQDADHITVPTCCDECFSASITSCSSSVRSAISILNSLLTVSFPDDPQSRTDYPAGHTIRLSMINSKASYNRLGNEVTNSFRRHCSNIETARRQILTRFNADAFNPDTREDDDDLSSTVSDTSDAIMGGTSLAQNRDQID